MEESRIHGENDLDGERRIRIGERGRESGWDLDIETKQIWGIEEKMIENIHAKKNV